MEEALWDPERLATVGSILTRYAAHLQPGHRIRLGIEGDPCNTFRGADAPCATVMDVDRQPNGVVHFRARLDGSRGVVELDNTNVHSVWEIAPDYLETFRGSVDEAEEYRGVDRVDALVERIDALEERVRDSRESLEGKIRDSRESLEDDVRESRKVLASTTREIAEDVMRAARGESVEFSPTYVDRYDEALSDRASEAFRGESKGRGVQASKRSIQEKEDFDYEGIASVTFRESEALTE